MVDQIEIPSLPEVKVTRDGKPVDTSAIDNYDAFMSFLMLSSIAANTAKMRRYYEDRTSIGEVQNFELAVTPTPLEIKCYPSQSIYVVNDGPGDIFVTINALTRTPTHLHLHDEMTDDFQTHKLYCFYVWSAPGTVATARAKVKQ